MILRKKCYTLKTKFSRYKRAISPVIATLLMIAITVVASLVAYAWVTGYLGSTTSKVSKAIQIQSLAPNSQNQLVAYVQNVGQGVVQFDLSSCVYVNGELRFCYINAGDNPLTEGQTAALTINYVLTASTPLKIKIVTIDGTSAEIMSSSSILTASSSPSPSPAPIGFFSEDFESGGLTAWTYALGSPTLQTAIKHYGNYAMSLDFSGFNNVIETLSSSTIISVRLYWYSNSLPDETNKKEIITVYDSTWTPLGYCGYLNFGGNYFWYLSGATTATYIQQTITAKTWYCIEFDYNADTDTHNLYINDILIGTNNDARTEGAVNCLIGSNQANPWTNGGDNTVYYDDVVVATSHIGP
jgi:flagellin-like protein